MVAVLDPRLERARYGGFLRASMPDFWYTTDRNQVRRSLAAIDEAAKRRRAARAARVAASSRPPDGGAPVRAEGTSGT